MPQEIVIHNKDEAKTWVEGKKAKEIEKVIDDSIYGPYPMEDGNNQYYIVFVKLKSGTDDKYRVDQYGNFLT